MATVFEVGWCMAKSSIGFPVTCLILNYDAPKEILRPCVESALTQGCSAVLVVDNGSKHRLDAVGEVAGLKGVRVVALGRNLGFAQGIMRGLESVDTPYVALINNDITLDEDSVGRCTEILAANPQIAGVGPKIVFADAPHVIDSVGVCINRRGEAWNRGIGQLDAGQFDAPKRVFGLCFAAAVLRTQALKQRPLNTRYFMYYEDVDWCLRINLIGGELWTQPEARAVHHHSFSTRAKGLAFRYHLAERNLIWTVLRCFEDESPAYRRLISHASCVLRMRRYPVQSAKIILETFPQLARLIRQRQVIQRSRVIRDDTLFEMSAGEASYFNSEEFSPLYGPDALVAAYSKIRPDLAQTARRIGNASEESVLNEVVSEAEDVQDYWKKAVSKRLTSMGPVGD